MARVIKQPRAERLRSVTLEETFTASRQPRIPGRAVRIEADDAAEAAPAFVPLSQVLRRADAALGVAPRTIEAPAPHAAGPVPAGEDEDAEADGDVPEEHVPSIEEIEAAWQARLEEATAAARAEGHAQGRAEAEAEAQQAIDAAHEACARDLSRIEAAWQQFAGDTEPLLAGLAFEIAEAILQAPLPDEVRAITEKALSDAVERLVGESSVDVTLHPVDYLRLEESGVAAQLTAMDSGLRWHPNPELQQGEWIVESPSAVVRRLQGELLDALRDRLGLLRKGPDDEPVPPSHA